MSDSRTDSNVSKYLLTATEDNTIITGIIQAAVCLYDPLTP